MTNIRLNKIHSWVKPIAIFAATWVVACPALALDSPVSDAGVTPMTVAYAPMQPVFQTAPALPKPRPDPALAYEIRPVDIAVPHSKPALKDVLPTSTATLAEMIKAQTGLDISTEADYKLRAGEGVGSILRRAGYTAADTAAAIEAAQAKASLRRLQIGMKFTIAEHGFRFSVKPGIDVYIIRNPEFGWLAINALRPIETYVAFIQGVIDDSIYRAAKQAGVNEAAFLEYVRLMGFSVDFQREVRRGDQFEMMYDTQRDLLSGDLVGVKLQYAGLSLSGDQLGFYRFDGAENAIGWYDENGNSAARTLIRTPISGARLSSNFGSRKHPVSGYNAMHKGVDFAAPRGTPIIAAGAGVVRQAGWKGSFGHYIRIKHNATYDTAYAHMMRIAPHIAPGSRVKQGEIIGYVGSTGRSTGPHLHYEILVNNRQVNPMTVRLPTGKQINPVHLDDFKQQVQMVEAEVLARGTQRFATALPIQPTP
ncbi:peptidoglycan DD-metalloendopeptidase family protein [Alphaproteobacteria bacterium]|nr:peptidoglycan DD-metalloendopeptidase family protein [Alphaproteobacteria bacterium]MDC1120812.1 peptidoglycan DD-metalloendopeptidase family protein [Alphaproteobacteria bacterium]